MSGEMVSPYFPVVYAVKHKDDNIRLSSRSGGVFTALSDRILDQGGIVYGCALEDNLEAVHKKAVTRAERDAFRGSKYVQSNLRDSFQEVKEILKEEKKVLFSGTSCQIAALQRYINGEQSANLLLVDIVCHGVPSPKVYRDYLNYMAMKKKGRISEVDFRNKKKYGWEEVVETLTINGTGYDSRIYNNLFIRNNILRPCCYKCPYKQTNHPGDITIADYWGVDKVFPKLNDNIGVSLVMINSWKGLEYFKKTVKELELYVSRLEDCMQPSMVSPVKEPDSRSAFWQDYTGNPFSYIVKKYASDSWKTRIKAKLRSTYHEYY
ncbi:MAG TPA: Coenzyme F420 hydrogenase/dehydrogenase, beta subunit C-terminal domain [Mobilitalea sp.]|nr:Coenzyme F420 hydrogenase/dehydrogenase, beta subunit C-terminal domain [Mobilitalea sp.]